MKTEKKVLFYGAGEFAVLTYRHVENKCKLYGEPVAFIDGDIYKQGHTLLGLPIISLEEAKKMYGENFYIYVTANYSIAPDIIGFLLENNIMKERIINYEPVEKRAGCGIAEVCFSVETVGDMAEYFGCTKEGDNLIYTGSTNRWPIEWTKATMGDAIPLGLKFIRNISQKIS